MNPCRLGRKINFVSTEGKNYIKSMVGEVRNNTAQIIALLVEREDAWEDITETAIEISRLGAVGLGLYTLGALEKRADQYHKGDYTNGKRLVCYNFVLYAIV